MKSVWCGLLLICACHGKPNPGAENTGSATTAGSAVTSGSAAAPAGSDAAPPAASAAAGPQVAALDELDRWLAPIYKLDVPARYKAMCAAGEALHGKAAALKPMPAPTGADAAAWTAATEGLQGQIDSVRMCCQDVKDYDQLTGAVKDGADSNHDDCMKPVPDAFTAVVKLVPGAKPFGTHGNDPVMK